MDKRPSLEALEDRGDFIRRHIGPDERDLAVMLAALDVASLDELIAQTIPADIQLDAPLNLPAPRSERVVDDALRRMFARNELHTSLIGMGYYDTITPNVIKRNVLENPGWYTAYTPYQAEISQGRLEALLNFQQMVIDLTGLPVANASLLDEATAAAEAMTMAHRISKVKSPRFIVDADTHPQTLAVVRTRAEPLGIEVVQCDPWAGIDGEYFGVLLSYPGSSGRLRDPSPVLAAARAAGALSAVAADPLALVLLKEPGAEGMGADIVFGSAQRFGVPMGYGGPHAAFFACRDEHKRQMPGRIIGVSTDANGRPALRMALQTREQHIRREKANSNICTAQVLLAVIASFYAVYHGPKGLRTIAERVHRMAVLFAQGLRELGFDVVHERFFDTVQVRVPGIARRIAARAREAGFNLHVIDADHLSAAFDETSRRSELKRLLATFATRADSVLDLAEMDGRVADCIPADLRRESAILTHPVFQRYHSETEMMRYMRRLAARDIALDRAMIPLGSCTMKLNSTTEMTPVTYRLFAALHPFVPLEQAQGYQQLFEELEERLCEITGFAAMSFQPNAGSQGEYAGLLVIRKYHQTRGQSHRNVCLIPASAHGTNPASAVLAGMEVVVVACDTLGNVDFADLKAKAEQHADRLAALMMTYPSTHGVFEEGVRDICALIHSHGGQVYMDGANMNAMVGLVRPGDIGFDVCHLNLHKTFCIPHGGGGPGMGPIGVAPHLAPFLPDHPVVQGVNPVAGPAGTIGAVSAAPWGSASILPIVWAYIALMGAAGLKRATQVAILNANYIAQKLAPHYPVLYTGKHGRVAHECIVDLRPLKDTSGVTVEDVAKRLMDYGFHAPTVSFPVPGTLMIEPTESENRAEIDRFCDAMIQIRAEIADIEAGRADRENNLLKHAPHTHELLIADEWERPYSRRAAFFPTESVDRDKYWPPVARVDNVAGDRNLVCTCPPLSEYR
ncbi:MAG: aminomethyl-transferring glycine dehydrogenase [Methyloversatilis discipulorum]|uniref:aminomethyl-transferring glycine dehydrogenase n=1 Tax=Methyloversatilis discipulorum TaxID=1119528 RepID=UPI0026ED71B6|nr:aminomethyl-transferring glycine dehydrogenase [Methyloversatilis discipulorum]MBV5285419.1 aminomethyl-transferring glycine dehydrogenase [Methyloversatilis discipulorum]